MAYEEKTRSAGKPHHVIMEERSKLSVTGVEDVERFDEDEIVLTTAAGALIIKGSELHMEKLSLDGGEVRVSGRVDTLSYEEKRASGGFFARLLGG